MKTCSKCRVAKPLSDFNTRSDRPSLYRSECKKCQQKTRTPERGRAYNQFHYAKRVGRIIKPEICEGCNEKKPLDAHHEDYSKPFDVKWLCSKCHKALHVKKSKAS